MNGAPAGGAAARAAGALLIATLSALALATPAVAQSPPFTLFVRLVARGASTHAAPSWLDEGTGRLTFGNGEGWQGTALGEAQLGADWQPSDHFAAHLHARVRGQSSGAPGDAAGIVEAWAQVAAKPRGGADTLRLRAGELFLPTSRENVDQLWSSPFTYTLSAINSWIGEEVRPIGVLADYDLVGTVHGVRAGACVFGGNDASGALLAWRGWTMGDRLSTLGETLPLPALSSLDAGGPFAGQDRDGTTPFGGDLDGRPGWAEYLRYRHGDDGLVQVTHWDNRGDRALHRGEYAWDTRFDQLGLQLHPHAHGTIPNWTIAGEHLRGRTTMGLPAPRADVGFDATYLLVSWNHRGKLTATARWDDFATRDRDHLPTGERSDEDGYAWTAALLWQATPALELGLEYVDMRVQRPALAGPGSRADGGRSVTVGVRYGRGW